MIEHVIVSVLCEFAREGEVRACARARERERERFSITLNVMNLFVLRMLVINCRCVSCVCSFGFWGVVSC